MSIDSDTRTHEQAHTLQHTDDWINLEWANWLSRPLGAETKAALILKKRPEGYTQIYKQVNTHRRPHTHTHTQTGTVAHTIKAEKAFQWDQMQSLECTLLSVRAVSNLRVNMYCTLSFIVNGVLLLLSLEVNPSAIPSSCLRKTNLKNRAVRKHTHKHAPTHDRVSVGEIDVYFLFAKSSATQC